MKLSALWVMERLTLQGCHVRDEDLPHLSELACLLGVYMLVYVPPYAHPVQGAAALQVVDKVSQWVHYYYDD